MLAERANSVVRVLANHARESDEGVYSGDIESLYKVLLKIASTLQYRCRRNPLVRLFAPKADASELEDLSSELDHAMRIFGVVIRRLHHWVLYG